jgi:hypothetical protein
MIDFLNEFMSAVKEISKYYCVSHSLHVLTFVIAYQIVPSFIDAVPRDEFVVIYIVNPFGYVSELGGTFNTHSEHFCAMLNSLAQWQLEYQQQMRLRMRGNVIFQFLDLDLIATTYETKPLAVFKQIAMNTYNKCRRTKKWQNRKLTESYFSMLHEPIFVLPSPVPCLSSSCLPNSDKIIEHQHIFMNCAYSILEQRCDNGVYSITIATVWSDCTGHLLESDLLLNKAELPLNEDTPEQRAKAEEAILKQVFQEIHGRSMMYMSSLSSHDQRSNYYYWDYVVCKYGRNDTFFGACEMRVWKSIFDQLSTRDLGTIGSMSVISVAEDPPLQLIVDNLSNLNTAENSNTFVIVDEVSAEAANMNCNANLFNRHTAKTRAYIVSSLNRNPFLLKEKQLEHSRTSQAPITVSFNDQEYNILEVCLYLTKQIAVQPSTAIGQYDWMHKLCKEFNDLSWLTVSPLHPFRESNLPVHLKLLKDITRNVTNFCQNNKASVVVKNTTEEVTGTTTTTRQNMVDGDNNNNKMTTPD